MVQLIESLRPVAAAVGRRIQTPVHVVRETNFAPGIDRNHRAACV